MLTGSSLAPVVVVFVVAWVPLEEKKAVKRVKKYLQTFTSNVIDFRILLLVCGGVYKEKGLLVQGGKHTCEHCTYIYTYAVIRRVLARTSLFFSNVTCLRAMRRKHSNSLPGKSRRWTGFQTTEHVWTYCHRQGVPRPSLLP